MSAENYKNRHITNVEEFHETRKTVMEPFGGWYLYEVVEFLEALIVWNKEKGREGAK